MSTGYLNEVLIKLVIFPSASLNLGLSFVWKVLSCPFATGRFAFGYSHKGAKWPDDGSLFCPGKVSCRYA